MHKSGTSLGGKSRPAGRRSAADCRGHGHESDVQVGHPEEAISINSTSNHQHTPRPPPLSTRRTLAGSDLCCSSALHASAHEGGDLLVSGSGQLRASDAILRARADQRCSVDGSRWVGWDDLPPPHMPSLTLEASHPARFHSPSFLHPRACRAWAPIARGR